MVRSLLTPIAFVPKSKKTPDREGGSTLYSDPRGAPPATLSRGTVSNLIISSKHGWQERAGVIVQARKVRHREDEGLAQLGAAPKSPGPGPRARRPSHTRCSWTPSRGARIVTRILTLHNSPWRNPPSTWPVTQMVLLYFPTVSRKILSTKCLVSRWQQILLHLTGQSEIETAETLEFGAELQEDGKPLLLYFFTTFETLIWSQAATKILRYQSGNDGLS